MERRNRLMAWVLAVGLTAMSQSAMAWGERGHRITGLVAQQLLTPEARKGIVAIMGASDLGSMSLYMDKFKVQLNQKYPGSREWHYDDRPVCAPDTPKGEYCPDGNCASVQITRHYRALIDEHSTLEEKRFAIHVLVHLIGDIHQPLHSSDHQDRGGNDVRVLHTLEGSARRTNLHSAWDTDFVKAAFSEVDERKIANGMVAAATQSDIAAMQKGSAAAWLRESFGIAKELAYGKLPGFSCDDEDWPATRLTLNESYTNEAVGLIPGQLMKAGARIAGVLNRAFSD